MNSILPSLFARLARNAQDGKRQKGVTLIEIAIAIVVIAVLAVIAIFTLTDSAENSRAKAVANAFGSQARIEMANPGASNTLESSMPADVANAIARILRSVTRTLPAMSGSNAATIESLATNSANSICPTANKRHVKITLASGTTDDYFSAEAFTDALLSTITEADMAANLDSTILTTIKTTKVPTAGQVAGICLET